MAEYIEREALQAALLRKKAGVADRRFTEGWNDCLLRVKSMVHSAPAADVAPVRHGRWEYNNSVNFWQCSRCGENAPMHGKWMQLKTHYCPNCGAKMDLEGGNT